MPKMKVPEIEPATTSKLWAKITREYVSQLFTMPSLKYAMDVKKFAQILSNIKYE